MRILGAYNLQQVTETETRLVVRDFYANAKVEQASSSETQLVEML